jgi:hypothetical protein
MYSRVSQALVQLCTMHTSNTSLLFLSVPHALAIRVGRLGQSASMSECHKARLTGANPAELMNTITTDANHVASLPN